MNHSTQDIDEEIEDRLPRDIDDGNLEMSMKDEYQQQKMLIKHLKD